MNLADDFGQRSFRCKRIADQRHVDAVRQRTRGDERKRLLVVALPIAAVNEGKQRRISRATIQNRPLRPKSRVIGNSPFDR
jgi:hypothetical protein